MSHFMSGVRRSVFAAAAVLLWSGVPARADDAAVSAADGAAIRQVVENQLAAFQKDDGAAAFGFAAPAIRDMFGTAANFMAMVRSGYQPVYRPRHVRFEQIDEIEGSPVQHVMLVGPDGTDVEALYYMEHQPDGHWLIKGCTIKPAYQA